MATYKLDRQELAVKYANENIAKFFPGFEKDSVKHGLAINGLAHGFSGGWRYSEDWPETKLEDVPSLASTYSFKYASRSGASFEDKEYVTKAFFNGFMAGLSGGLTQLN